MELLTLSINQVPILGEIPDYGVDDALQILQNNSFISNKLAESFQTVTVHSPPKKKVIAGSQS